MKRRKFKIKDIVMTHKHQIIQVILCNIITLYFYTLSFYNNKNEKKKKIEKKKDNNLKTHNQIASTQSRVLKNTKFINLN